LGCLLGGVPAVAFHLLVDTALHIDAVVEGGAECLLYIGGGGLNGTVHIKVDNALGVQEDALHNFSVAHFTSSLDQIIKLGKQLLVSVHKLLYLLAKHRV